ncbi:MAG: hypothetical protein Q9170_000752 [Blastenia crenularia]
MTRVTRAALRSQIFQDNANGAAATPLPTTIRQAPLGEISGNQEKLPVAVENPESVLKPNRCPGKGKKGKALKEYRKGIPARTRKQSEKVLPDGKGSETSFAVEDACQNLMKEQDQVTQDKTPHTPPSPAVMAATEQLSQETTPPESPLEGSDSAAQLDPILSSQSTSDDGRLAESAEGALSPAGRPKKDPSKPHLAGDNTGGPDKQPGSQDEHRSPLQVKVRPEDSIEAMDRFEDEIEKVGDMLPAANGSTHSPTHPQSRGKTTLANRIHAVKNGPNVRKTSASPKISPNVNPNAAALLKKGAVVHPSAFSAPKITEVGSKDRQVSDSSIVSERASNVAKKRISSIHKAPFVPARSTKPPTRSNFQLPGEAVARKLKEAREERMNREGEEKLKKPAFKARPVRLSQAPLVKPTATSRARISIAKGEVPPTAAVKNATPRVQPSSLPSAVSASSAGKRLSTMSTNKRSAPAFPNTSARVTRRPLDSDGSKPAARNPARQSILGKEAVQLKAKGIEVFNRGKIEQDERDRMRKEKEEAAKNARIEAAERGRIASREWAEKQKARKMAEKKANTDVKKGGDGQVSAA